jgi:hypothetical protein
VLDRVPDDVEKLRQELPEVGIVVNDEDGSRVPALDTSRGVGYSSVIQQISRFWLLLSP